MSKLLSIIFPTYNVGTKILSLIESFNSLEKNILAEIDFIFVDDKSEQKEDQLIKKNAKFKYRIIKNKKNMGLSLSRYEGFKNSNSKYVWFFDSDDTLSVPDFLKLFKLIKQEDYDVILFNWIYSKNFSEMCKFYHEKIFSRIDRFEINDYHDVMELSKQRGWGLRSCSMWSKIFKSNFLIENKIEFKHYKIHEDTYTWFQCLRVLKNALYIDLSPYVYNWFDGSNSLMQQANSKWKLNCDCMLSVFEDLYTYFKDKEINDEFKKTLFLTLNDYLYSNIHQTRVEHRSFLKWYKNQIKELRDKTEIFGKFSKKTEFKYFLYFLRNRIGKLAFVKWLWKLLH